MRSSPLRFRDAPLADASAWIVHSELADFCSVQKTPLPTPPHPEKIFFVCRSCPPPGIFNAANRDLRGSKFAISSTLSSSACDPAGKADLPARGKAVLLLIFQEGLLRFEGHP